ncbi:MAG: alpha/beta hydrolase [Candidatus Diapherotrites archaeon]|nr:alpha/beta hydrolase [Candidatus Diapherotrites archaeon]
MKKVFLFHGSFGSPEENWFPWLKNELQNSSFEVFAPEFPTPKGQSLDSWKKVFQKFEKEIDEESIFVCHSLGGAFALHLLEKLNLQISACFFVASFVELLGDKKFDEVNKSFVLHEFDWAKIRKNCAHFEVLYSDNDPYVSLSCAEKIAKELGVKVQVVKGAGHFNSEAGYEKFPMLLEKIRKMW